jgi:hypothetical protein
VQRLVAARGVGGRRVLFRGESFGMERLLQMEDSEHHVVLTAQSMKVATLLWMRPSLLNAFKGVRHGPSTA